MVFITEQSDWGSEHPWLDVLLDLGTFLGEAAIVRAAGFHWSLYAEVAPGLQRSNPSFQSIVVRSGDPSALWRLWIFDQLVMVCRALREGSFLRAPPRYRLLSRSDRPHSPSRFIINVERWAA